MLYRNPSRGVPLRRLNCRLCAVDMVLVCRAAHGQRKQRNRLIETPLTPFPGHIISPLDYGISMEDLLNRVLNPILGRFLANKEKPNLKLNFLKGRGVMRNLVFNTEEINKLLQDAPIRVAMLAIDQLSIKASLTRISTQPVTIFIDHINLDVYEPPVTPARRPAASDPVDGAPRLPQPSRRPYGLSDRIADGIRVEVNEVRVRVRTLGKRKCPQVGEWSPPDGLLILRNVQWCSTNEAGVEGDLDECWRSNKGRRADYYVFKRMSVEAMSFYVVPRTAGGSGGEGQRAEGGSQGPVPSPSPIAVLRPTPLECRVTYRRGLRDVGLVHGVEVDVSLDRAVLRLGRADGSLRHFLACAVGVAHCLARKHAMPHMPPAQAGEDGCQPTWPRDYGEGARVGPSAAGGWSGPSSAFSSSSALTQLDDVALEQHEDRDGQHGTAGGHGEEQGDEEEDEEEEGDEESVGSDDSGFSNGVSAASFLPDLSSLGEGVDVDLGDDDDQTTTTVSHTSSAAPSYAPSSASPGSPAKRASPRMRVALSLTFAHLEVRVVDDGEGGFQVSMDGLRSEVIRAEDAGPSEFIGQGRLGRFEVRALGGDEEVLWHQPALLRPHCPPKAEGSGEAQVSQLQGATAFPSFVRRGIRLDRDFPGLADEEAQDDSGQGLTGGGEVLRVRNHVFAHPPPPPPEVASRVEARMARLHVHLDTDAWARLTNLLRAAMDRRWWDGDWGPALEGYVLQPPMPLGIRHIVLRGEGLGVHLPPACGMSRAEGAYMGAAVEVSVASYSLRVGDHLPGCLADAPGFLDPRLPSTPPDPPTPTPRGPTPSHASAEDGPSHTPAPLRLQVSVSGVSLCVGSTSLLGPFASTMLLSIDAQGPLPDSPQPLAYVPLSRQSRLSVSLSLEPLCLCLHLPSWLSLVESLTAHLATIGRLAPTHAHPPPSPQPQGAGFKGAALLLVLKAGGLRLVLPEHGSLNKWEQEAMTAPEGRGSRHEEKGETGRSPVKRAASKKEEEGGDEALLSVEVTAVEAVAHVSHSGVASFDCLVGRCALGVRDTQGMLEVAEVAPLPRGSRRGGEEGQGKEAGVLVRWRREAPMPSSERAAFLAPHPPPDEQAGPDVAIRLSLQVLCPLTLRAPLPCLTAAATDLHALLSHPHASSLPLPPSSPSSAFPPGSLAHALLCLLPRPALHPLTPSPLLTGHSRHRAAVGVVDVALTSVLLHVPLPCAPSHAAGGMLKASMSEGAVHGSMELKRRGERAEQTWTVDGTLHASLSTPQKHRQAPVEVPALSNWRVGMGLRVLPSGGGEGEHGHSGWRVMWQPPTQPLTLHPSTQLEHALRRVQVDLRAFLTTCGDLFGGRPSGGFASLQQLDRWIAAMGATASDPTAACTPQAQRVANGDEVEEDELDVIERLAGTLRGELHAHAWHATQQAAALSQRLHATQQALAHATQSSTRQLEAMGEQVRHKEVQRLALLALHHADHSGYLRIGALASAPTNPGRAGRQKGWSSKALLSLPRAYCVLRGGLLLCHDRPHSLVVEQALPLRAEAIADFFPRDHAAPRHCRRAHALLYRGTPLLPDSGSNRAFLLVAEGEEDLRQWRAALAAYLPTASLGPQHGPDSGRSSPRATSRRATAPAICRAQSLDHLPPPAPSTTRSLRRTLLGRGVSNEASSSIDGPTSEATGAAPRDGPLSRAGKTLKHSFSFSPGRMLLRAATPGRPMDTAPTPIADKDRPADDVDGTQQAQALQQAAEGVRRLQLSVTGVVASAAGGGTAHRPEGEAGTGLGSSWGSTRDTPLPCYIIATSAPLAEAGPGAVCEGPEGSGVQACVSRTWAELLSFHGRYHDRWAAATQAADEEDEASGDKATPRMRSLLPRQASASGGGLQRGEARGYANALLMGMQAALGTLATHEAGRRMQGETVERYLRLLLPACPADLECLRLLSDFLGHDLGAHKGPARSTGAVGTTASAQHQRGREGDTAPAPDSRSTSPVPPLPRPRPRGFSALVPPSSSHAPDTIKHRRTVSLAPSVGGAGDMGPSARPPDPALDEVDEVERVAAEMAGLRQAVHELQHAHQGAAVALALQSALFDDYRRVGRRQREEERRARRVAESRWRREVRRASWLEAQLHQAQAARDDALAGLDQVTSYSARKLVDAEGRYEQLLRSGGPRPAVHKAMSIRRLSAVFTGNKQHRQHHQHQQQQQSPQTRWGGGPAHGAHHGLTRQNTVTGAETSAAPPAHLHRQLSLPAHTDHHASPRRNSNPLMDEAESSVDASVLERLSRALEAKSLEAKRAEEGMKVAVEEARSLRALLEGQGGLGESEGRRLREEVGRERARAEALERELGQVRAEWRATVGEAVEALRGDRRDGTDRTKCPETRGQAMLQALLKALNARGRSDGLQDN